MSWFCSMFKKNDPVRECPVCNIVLRENQMLMHRQLCYSTTFTKSVGQFYAEYRGDAAQLDGAVASFKNQVQQHPSKYPYRNERDGTNTNIHVNEVSDTNRSVDSDELANKRIRLDNSNYYEKKQNEINE